MMVDSGYTGQNFANEISSLTSAKVIVVKKNELHQFLVIPQSANGRFSVFSTIT